MSRRKPYDGPPTQKSAIHGKPFYVSPTAVDQEESCSRLAFVQRVARIKLPRGAGAQTGSYCHSVLEDHLDGLDVDEVVAGRQKGRKYGGAHVAMMRPALENGLFPAPGSVNSELSLRLGLSTPGGPMAFNGKTDYSPRTAEAVEVAASLAVKAEGDGWAKVERAGGLTAAATYHPSGLPFWIGDLKSSSDPERWGLTVEQLASPVRDTVDGKDGLQMLSYAYVQFGPHALLPGGPPAAVGLTHVYVATKGKPRAFRRDAVAPWADIERNWRERVIPAAARLATYAPITNVADVPPNVGPVCGKYRGCGVAKAGHCPEGAAYLANPGPPGWGTLVGLAPPRADDSLGGGMTASGGKAPAPSAPPSSTKTTATATGAPMTKTLSPLQRKLMGLPPLAAGAAAPPAKKAEAPAAAPAKAEAAPATTTAPAGDPPPVETTGAVNPPDASATATPTAAQVAEAAELVKVADGALGRPAPDEHVARLLTRQGLDASPEMIATVVATAREGADPTPPGGKGPAGAVEAPAPAPKATGADAMNLAAAKAVAEALGALPAGAHLAYESKDADVVTVRSIVAEALDQSRPRKSRVEAILTRGKSEGLLDFDAGLTARLPGGTAAGDGELPLGYDAAAEVDDIAAAKAAEAEAAAKAADDEALAASAAARAEASAKGREIAAAEERRQAAAEAAKAAKATASTPDAPAAGGGGNKLEPALNTPTTPPATATAPAKGKRPAIPSRVVVFVDCLPVGLTGTTLDELIAAWGREVAANNRDRNGALAPVPTWTLIPYRQGAAAISARLDAAMLAAPKSAPLFSRLFVSSNHPAAPECLAVIATHPGVLIVRGV